MYFSHFSYVMIILQKNLYDKEDANDSNDF